MNPQTLLINLQKYIVHAKKDAQENPWHINDLLPAVVAYIFPFYQELLKSKDKGKFQELVIALKPFVSRNKKRLVEYTFDALCNAVKDKWIPELENPFSLLNSVSPIYFENIDENGYVFLNPITINSLMGRPFDDLPRQYGTSDYAAQEVTCSTTAKVLRERIPRKNNQIDSKAMDDAQTELLELFKKLGETRKHNPNCYRHDIFFVRELTDWETPQYTWQWNFSKDEYDTIKQLLKKHASVLKEVIKQNKICCKLLQLYVSEWYKRDFNGNDRQGNAYGSLVVDNLSEEICKQLLGGDYKQKVYHDNADDTGDGRYIDTIYVDGGLPLNYLIKNNNTAFRKAIECIIESNAEGICYEIDELGDICNNQVVNQSYQAKILFPNKDASIYFFIQEVVIKENVKIEGFEDFNTLVRESNEKALKRKFELRCRIYKTAKCFQLIPQLFLKQETDDNHYAISDKRLRGWNIQPHSNRFVLEIKNEDGGEVWKKQFDKCLAGYYITFPKKDRFDLKIDKQLCLSKWDIRIDGRRITDKALSNDLLENGYIKMYSKDGFSWYSHWSSDYNYSAVLFDKNRVSEESEIDDENFGWVQIEDSLKLTVDGKETIFYNKAGDLYIEHESKPLNGYFKGRDAEGKQLFLIYSGEKPAFKVLYSKGGTDTDISNKASYKYRYGRSGNFSQLDTIDRYGYVEINIKYEKNNKEKTIRCFAISKDAQIFNYNDGNSARTDFRHFDGLIVYFKNGESLEKLSSDYKKHWVFNDNDYHHPEAIYQITDGDVKFELSCYKPINATIVKKKLNGSIVNVGSNNARLKMPILVLDKILVQQLRAKQSENDNDTAEQNRVVEIDEIRFRSYAFKALLEHSYGDNNRLSGTYLDFQTFTHTRENIYNIDLRGLSFIFVPTSHPLDYQPVSLIKELPRFGIESQEEGIVVQYIYEYEIPKVLLKPIYIPAHGNNLNLNEKQRRNKRNERINEYHYKYEQFYYEQLNPDYSDALAYFEIAVKSGMYFGGFDALLGMICHLVHPLSVEMKTSNNAAKHLAHFYKCYCEKCDRQFITPNYKALWRFADEFMFDWILIPRNIWCDLFSGKNEKVVELLRNKPRQHDGYIDFIQGNYWSSSFITTRNINKEKEFIKWLKKIAKKLNVTTINGDEKSKELILKIKTKTGNSADFDKQCQEYKDELSAEYSKNENLNIIFRTISGIDYEEQASFWKQDLNKRIQVLKVLDDKKWSNH